MHVTNRIRRHEACSICKALPWTLCGSCFQLCGHRHLRRTHRGQRHILPLPWEKRRLPPEWFIGPPPPLHLIQDKHPHHFEQWWWFYNEESGIDTKCRGRESLMDLKRLLAWTWLVHPWWSSNNNNNLRITERWKGDWAGRRSCCWWRGV